MTLRSGRPARGDRHALAQAEKKQPTYGLASAMRAADPKTLPRRLLEDEEKGLKYPAGSREFAEAFEQRAARSG